MPILLDEPITSTPRLTDAIVDGETGKAPAQNAVFDALALKTDAASLGAGLVTATGGSTARTLSSRFAVTLQPEDFGAVGDGSWAASVSSGTDNATAIGNASQALETATGGALYFDAKTYRSTTGLSKNKRVWWQGEGTPHPIYWEDNNSRGGTVLLIAGAVSDYSLKFEGTIEGNVGIARMGVFDGGTANIAGIVQVPGILHWSLTDIAIRRLGTSKGIGLHVAKSGSAISLYGYAANVTINNVQTGLQIDYDCNSNTFEASSISGDVCALKMIGDGTYQPRSNRFNGVAFENTYSSAMTHEFLEGGTAARYELIGYTYLTKYTVRVATTANLAIATALENGDTVDGVTLATGDLVLVKDQSTASQNGIYVVPAAGAASRATFADASAEIISCNVNVTAGSVNANRWYRCDQSTAITVGSSTISFTQLTKHPDSVYIAKLVQITHGIDTIFNGCYFECASPASTYSDGSNGTWPLISAISLEHATLVDDVQFNACDWVNVYLRAKAKNVSARPYRDDTNYSNSVIPYVVARATGSAQSIPTAAWTALNVGDSVLGTAAQRIEWDASRKLYVVLVAGTYLMGAQVYFESMPSGVDFVQCRIVAGGITYECVDPRSSTTGNAQPKLAPVAAALAAGDTIQLSAFQASGSNQDVNPYPTLTYLSITALNS